MRKQESACAEADLHRLRICVCRCGALHDIIHFDAHSASGSASKGHCLGGLRKGKLIKLFVANMLHDL